MESETALNTLKADHESALATQSESFAAIKKDLMARVASAEASADKRISAVVEEHQQVNVLASIVLRDQRALLGSRTYGTTT